MKQYEADFLLLHVIFVNEYFAIKIRTLLSISKIYDEAYWFKSISFIIEAFQ